MVLHSQATIPKTIEEYLDADDKPDMADGPLPNGDKEHRSHGSNSTAPTCLCIADDDKDDDTEHVTSAGLSAMDTVTVSDSSNTGQSNPVVVEPAHKSSEGRSQRSGDGCSELDSWKELRVPFNALSKHGNVIDIVTPDSTSCNCFTKSYSRYVKGTGSVLATKMTHLLDSIGHKKSTDRGGSKQHVTKENGITTELLEVLRSLDLRYFSPREVARLHSLPPEFCFPSHVSLRQRYLLLGNSLNVRVVADLLVYLLHDADEQGCVGG